MFPLVISVPDNIKRDQLIKYFRDCEIETMIGTYSLSGTMYFQENMIINNPTENF